MESPAEINRAGDSSNFSLGGVGGMMEGRESFCQKFRGEIGFKDFFRKIGTFSYLLGEDKEILEEAPAMGTT